MRISDWSSDVCSSDLVVISEQGIDVVKHEFQYPHVNLECVADPQHKAFLVKGNNRSSDRYTALHRAELLCFFSQLKNRHQILFNADVTLLMYDVPVRVLVYSASIAYGGDKHSNAVLLCDFKQISLVTTVICSVVVITLHDGFEL